MKIQYLLRAEQMENLDQVVTAAEWAKHCGVTPQYIRRLCAEGKLAARQTDEGVWLIVKPKLAKEVGKDE